MQQWVASDEGIRTENFLAMIIQKLDSAILRIRVTDSYCLIRWMKSCPVDVSSLEKIDIF